MLPNFNVPSIWLRQPLGLIDADPNRINETACYQGYKLIATHSREMALETQSAGPTFDTPGSPPNRHIRTYLTWTRWRPGATTALTHLSISVINRHRHADISAHIVLSGGGSPTPEATVYELNGAGALARNTYDDQSQTWIAEKDIVLAVDNGAFEYEFPAHSATV